MNNLFKLLSVSLCFVGAGFAETTPIAPEAPEKAALEKAAPEKAEKKATTPAAESAIATEAARDEKRLKRKMERAKQLLENNFQEYKDTEGKFLARTDITDVVKKKIQLALSHAKLELEAAQDPALVDDILWHTRQAKRYIQRSKYVLEGKLDQFKERAKEKMKKVTEKAGEVAEKVTEKAEEVAEKVIGKK